MKFIENHIKMFKRGYYFCALEVCYDKLYENLCNQRKWLFWFNRMNRYAEKLIALESH